MKFSRVNLEQRLQLHTILTTRGPLKVAETLDHLKSLGHEEEFAKHIIRQSMDRGEVKTDGYFRLNAGKLPEDRISK